MDIKTIKRNLFGIAYETIVINNGVIIVSLPEPDAKSFIEFCEAVNKLDKPEKVFVLDSTTV